MKEWPTLSFEDLNFGASALDGVSSENTEILNEEQIKEKVGSSSKTFNNSKYDFSFKYPDGFNISEFKEGEGDIVLAQMQGKEIGFQFFIMPFDEPGPITAERIKQDLPDMKINNPQSVIIGKNNIKALIFFTNDSGFGLAREVWFIYQGNLYQVSTYAKLDLFIGQVLSTLSFK